MKLMIPCSEHVLLWYYLLWSLHRHKRTAQTIKHNTVHRRLFLHKLTSSPISLLCHTALQALLLHLHQQLLELPRHTSPLAPLRTLELVTHPPFKLPLPWAPLLLFPRDLSHGPPSWGSLYRQVAVLLPYQSLVPLLPGRRVVLRMPLIALQRKRKCVNHEYRNWTHPSTTHNYGVSQVRAPRL